MLGYVGVCCAMLEYAGSCAVDDVGVYNHAVLDFHLYLSVMQLLCHVT